jgi:hypothetical protein
MALTDLWSDIHRIKHKRDRDQHPCQLPDRLMERIIEAFTAPGEIVLDALSGAGTTSIIARKLGRRYFAIEINASYTAIIEQKMSELEKLGYIPREKRPRPRSLIQKKGMQQELLELARRLKRLPTEQDIITMSNYKMDDLRRLFSTFGKALRAIKVHGIEGEEI